MNRERRTEKQIRNPKSSDQREKGCGRRPHCDDEINRLAAEVAARLKDRDITMPARSFVPTIEGYFKFMEGDRESLKSFPSEMFAALCAQFGLEEAKRLLELDLYSLHFGGAVGMREALDILDMHISWANGSLEPTYWAQRRSRTHTDHPHY